MNDVTDTADTTDGQDPTTVEDATAAGGGASDWAPADESTSSGLQQAPREECIVVENVVKTFGEVVPARTTACSGQTALASRR